MSAIFRDIVRTQFRLLAFRSISPNLADYFWQYLVFVLMVTWMAGIGRYWDHPDAYAWQYAGLGSVIYIFALSAFLYGIVRPLQPANWSFRLVLIFVGMTSLPALLYAIPVERFMPLEEAQITNAWFLGIVAAWRVALYAWLLRTAAGLNVLKVLVAVLLPLSAIVVALSALNLEHVVFNIMSGIREDEQSANDIAYTVVFNLSVLAFMAFPVTLILYLVAIFTKRSKTPSESA